MKAVLYILGSVALMALADALIKLSSATLSLWQIFVMRSAVGLPLTAGVALAAGSRLGLRRPGWALIRSGLLVLTWLLYYASLGVLPLSVAAAAIYTNPILTALLTAVVLRRPVGARCWCGMALGFAGMLFVVRPDGAISPALALPLLAALTYAVAMILTHAKCQDESPLALACTLQGAFLLTGLAGSAVVMLWTPGSGLPFLAGPWGPAGADVWALMAALALLSVLYFAGVARAYQTGAPPVIAAFDYAYLLWAALWGAVIFAERPTVGMLAGMALIAAGGFLATQKRGASAPAS
ncbi:DMT family transporter [Primorskyibacter flagellatus]|nr:DMT family transporter [Primorskyibacter flagellatus]